MKTIYLTVPLLILLFLSISANVYSFNKISTKTNSHIDLLEEKDKEINSLKTELSKAEKTAASEKKDIEQEHDTHDAEQQNIANSSSDKEIINAAKRYLEFALNINPENYATAKQQAHNYMTDQMVEFLYSSDGLDNDVHMKIKNIKIYTTDETNKEVIAYYESEIETYETKHPHKNYNYVLLQLEEDENILKVSNISPINIAGAN